MIPLLRITLFLVLFCQLSFVWGQSQPYSRFTTNEGLPSDVIYYLFEDSKGYLWIATGAGVARFNGESFTNFTPLDGLPDYEVLRIYQDSKERIWFLSVSGKISYFDKGRVVNAQSDPRLGAIPFNSWAGAFMEDREGNIWIGSWKDGVVKITEDTVRHFPVKQPSKYRINAISFFLENEDTVQVFTKAELEWGTYSRGKTNSITGSIYLDPSIATPLDSESYLLSAFKHHPQKSTLDLAHNTLIRVDYQGVKIEGHFNRKDHFAMFPYVDGEGNIWIVTQNEGAWRFEKGNIQSEPTIYLPDENVSSMLVTPAGGYWFGTKGNGLIYFPPVERSFERLENQSDISSTFPNCLLLDAEERLWIGSESGALFTLQANKAEVIFEFDPPFRFSEIKALEGLGKKLWLGSSSGLYLVSDVSTITRGQVFYAFHLIHNEYDFSTSLEWELGKKVNVGNVKSIALWDENNAIVGSSRGAYHVRYEAGELMSKKILSSRTNKVATGNSDEAWMYNKGKLWQYQNDSLTAVEIPCLDSPQILEISSRIEGKLWLGTAGMGICLLEAGSCTVLDRSNGLPGEICSVIYPENDSIIWVGSNRGVTHIVFDPIEKVARSIHTFSSTEGLLGNDVRDIVVKGDSVYIVTNQGVSILPKDNLNQEVPHPVIYLNQVQIAGNDTSILEYYQLPYTDNTLRFGWEAVSYQGRENISFQYRMLGKEWIKTQNTEAIFTGLSPVTIPSRCNGSTASQDNQVTPFG